MDQWNSYHLKTQGIPHRPLLETAISYIQANERLAVDAGCGAGADTEYLGLHNFRVTAFDNALSAVQTCSSRFHNDERIQCLRTSFSDFYYPACSLFWASQSLYFCQPKELPRVVKRALSSLLPGGVFMADVLGPSDSWVTEPSTPLAYCEQKHFKQWAKGLEILSLTETKEDGTTIMGEDKHWHILTAVVRKPLDSD